MNEYMGKQGIDFPCKHCTASDLKVDLLYLLVYYLFVPMPDCKPESPNQCKIWSSYKIGTNRTSGYFGYKRPTKLGWVLHSKIKTYV